MSAERLDTMTTSEPSQGRLFEDGSLDHRQPDNWYLTPTTISQNGGDPSITEGMARRFVEGKRGNLLENVAAHEFYGSTSSPLATHASLFLMPGSDWARRMTAISGRRLRGLLPTSDRVGACLRTLLDTSRWASTTCWLTWKPLATPGGRQLFRLAPSVPRTGGIGFGLWPTPNVPNGGRGFPRDAEYTEGSVYTTVGRKVQVELHHAVKMWPTPRTEGHDAGAHRGNPDSLHSAVKLLPTPHANCGNGTGQKGEGGPNLQTAALLPTPQKADGERGSNTMYRGEGNPTLRGAAGGKLCAAWVSRMMGFPDDWLNIPDTSISDGTATLATPSDPTGKTACRA
jgi:hypothetical protein